MAISIRGKADEDLRQIAQVLKAYSDVHPHAQIALYRSNPAVISIRIIDPEFARTSRGVRHDRVWDLFEPLPEEVVTQIMILLLLTPSEAGKSFANMDFEHRLQTRRKATSVE